MIAVGAQRAPGGIHTLRRVIMLLLLAILVSVAASGITGLLHLVLETDPVLDDSGFRLAQGIASVIIAAPLGALVYWLTRRWLISFNDRHSVLWPVYLAAFGTVALLIAVFGLIPAAARGIAGVWEPSSFAIGIVWLAIWAWHAWMWRTPSHAPSRLPDVGPSLGVLVGVGVTVTGAIGALSHLFGHALRGSEATLAGTTAWWIPVLQQLVWVAVGSLLWWWHWRRVGIRDSDAVFARFILVIIAGLIAVGTTLGGLASAIYSLASLAFGIGGPVLAVPGHDPLIDQLATSVAAAAVGSILWAQHRRPIAAAAVPVRWSARLVASGVALAFAASGLGVIVNAVLAATVDRLAGDERSLLFGGLSALLVGAVAWWLLWRPTDATAVDSDAAGSWASFPGRRAYLVVIFGVSALTAVITLLVIAYGVLESLLGVPWSGSVIESIRAPLGLLTATALVAVYHFVVWRRTPTAPPAEAGPRIDHITLVASGDTRALASSLRAATGASVTVWHPRQDIGTGTASGTSSPDAATVVEAVAAVEAPHVLVLALADRLEVVTLSG